MSETKYYKSTHNNKIYAERDGEQWYLVIEVIFAAEVPGRATPLMSPVQAVEPYWHKIDDNKLCLFDTCHFQEVSRLHVAVLYGLGEPVEKE